MATRSSVLACRIPGTGQPGGLPSMGSHRVGHTWSDLAAAAAAVLLPEFAGNETRSYSWNTTLYSTWLAVVQKELLASHFTHCPPPQLLIGLRKHVLFSILLAFLAEGIGSDGKNNNNNNNNKKKNLPAMRETWVRSLSQEDPQEEGLATHSSILQNPMDRGAWWATVRGVAKSQTRQSE